MAAASQRFPYRWDQENARTRRRFDGGPKSGQLGSLPERSFLAVGFGGIPGSRRSVTDGRQRQFRGGGLGGTMMVPAKKQQLRVLYLFLLSLAADTHGNRDPSPPSR